MNLYAGLILAALAVGYLLGVAGDLLNLRALESALPREFSEVYDARRYRRSQAYTRARMRFGLIPATFHLGAILVFWFSGGVPWLDGLLRGFEFSPIATGLLFIGCLTLARAVLSIPFRGYSTFVIEERFGFNTTTPRTFASDTIKGLLLGIAFGTPLLAAILWFFQTMGSAAWLGCWLATTVFFLFAQLAAPTWIFPLFHRFEPLPEGELRDSIVDYARKASFPLEGLFVIDGSRRSKKANAFFTGIGKHRRVALFDTLIEKHPSSELVAIVAHEIGHYKMGHILKGLAFAIIHAGIVFFLLSIFLEHQGLYDAFYLPERSIYAGLVFFGMLFLPIDLVLSLLVRALSRRHEFEADAYARDTGLGPGLAAGLKRLSADSLANLTPHPFYVMLHDSHPPLAARIAALHGEG